MKKVEVIIKPFRFEYVKEALAKLGILGMTLAEVKGFGREKGHTERYGGNEYTTAFLPNLLIIIILKDAEVDAAIEAILQAAHTGKVGDGMIFVHSVENAVHITTKDKGLQAL